MRTEKHSYNSYGRIDGVFPCRCQHECPSIISIMVFSSSLLWLYICSCTHMMSIVYLAADAVSSGNWFIVSNVLILKIVVYVSKYEGYSIYLSIYYAFLSISPFYYLLPSTLEKRIFAQNTFIINTISIYRSNSLK